MEGLQKGKDWLRGNIRRIPVEYRESFLRETGTDNLIRLRLLCLVLIALSVLFFVNPGIFEAESASLPISPYIMNLLFSSITILTLAGSQVIFTKLNSCPAWLIRLPVILIAVCQLWWGCYAGSLHPFGLTPTIYFMICLFVLSSVFILSIAETIGIMLNGLIAFYWFHFSSANATVISAGSLSGLLFFLSVAFFVSRVVYYRRLSAFLNWENISSMNSTLKWEIKKHQQTLQELEAIKNDLDQQVSEKTSYLRDTNKRLHKEIAERSYADKVRTVLYRISGFVNQNGSLTEIIRSIHEQLRQILDVTNFMVGTYDSERLVIEPVYQENSTESFERYRLGRTLSSYVIRHKRSLLVNKKGIRELVAAGEVEIIGVPAYSWLGVPLMVDDRVVGIVMVQSYKSIVIYDQSDLQLLEYVSEHLALAIDRYEVQSKLIKAKEQAEESDRLKSAFLSNLSHEIRTPMNAILGFSEMIGESNTTDIQRQQYTSRVLENGHRLLTTLTKMIELAKLQAHQMPFDIQDLQVEQAFSVLRDEINPVISLFKKTDLEIRFVCDSTGEKLSFLADPMRFKQLVLCLAENAVKFTDHGYMEIGCRKYDQRQLLFWVKDSGIGMNNSDLEHIFEWFIKGQKASENLYEGTGLGLTITKLIVELMNGQIWAESEPGKGSCFYFTLPAVMPESIKMIPERRDRHDSFGTEHSVHAG
ncbi:MAG: GAF domain-containing protein [Porphyromonadaceae bacterium]|nr:MAG: GAF domain-containing protein [Porphyromonadaceae bacterium]